MDLMEFQAKELFAGYGVPVSVGSVVESAEGAGVAAEALGGSVVVKAQVQAGGRGKAGGVRLAGGRGEAVARAAEILGLVIKGHPVRRVLVAPAAEIAEEYYFSFVVDRGAGGYLCVASVQGGVEIEQVAAADPGAVAKVPVDPVIGVDEGKAREIVAAAGFPAAVAEEAVGVVLRLWRLFVGEDASLVEVNPLVRLADGHLEALDGKVSLDDNAGFRHLEHARFAEVGAADPLEAAAAARDLNYVKLDGRVGVIGNGAGLVMSTLDVVAYAGQEFGGVKPANFLDIGGGASAEVMASGLEIVLGDPDVAAVLVNVFGGITACDAVADGIVSAFDLLAEQGAPVDKPLVVRLDGNNAEAGRAILDAANLPGVERVDTMDGAARRAAELAATTSAPPAAGSAPSPGSAGTK